MHQSKSCPDLTRPSSATAGRPSSASKALKALPLIHSDVVLSSVITEMQLEAVAHTPAYIAGPCLLQAPPPQEMSDDDTRNLAACIACPPDPLEEPPRFPLGTSLLEQTRVEMDRFGELLVRVRRNRRMTTSN